MATLKPYRWAVVTAVSLVACGKPVGLNGTVTPIAKLQVQATGDLAAVAPGGSVDALAGLRVAVMWGMPWQPEPFCVLTPESPEVAAVMDAGCPDNFRFVPDRPAADAPLTASLGATLDLVDLPSADVMVGDLTARVAYASFILYDDRNGNGALDLRHPPRRRRHGNQPVPEDDAGATGPRDQIYGASFISMTQPDRRLAFREGAFNAKQAFYPRKGCDQPPHGYSLLSAGGFSPSEALATALQGEFPAEDPATCAATLPNDRVEIPVQLPEGLSQLACTVTDSGGDTTYREAPKDPVDLTNRAWACAHFPHLPSDDAGVPDGWQLVVSTPFSDACKGLAHYTLRGCDNDPACATPGWDFTNTPPAWWPCPNTP